MQENNYHKMCKSGWEGIAQERRNQEFGNILFLHLVSGSVLKIQYFKEIEF